MKVYEKIVIDMKTLETVEEVSFEYDGPIAKCDGGDGDGGGGSSGSAIGTAVGSALGPIGGIVGGIIGGSIGSANFGGSGGGEPEGAGNIGGVGTGIGPIGGVSGSDGGGGVGGGPGEFRTDAPGWENSGARYAISAGGSGSGNFNYGGIDTTVTGTEGVFLSDEEKAMLDEIEGNRVKMLTDAINEKVYEIQQTEISNLVARGVLQSDVGATSMAKTRDYASQAIEQGTLSIGTQRMQDELNFLNSKRDFSLKEDALKWDMNKFVSGLEWQSQQNALDRALSEQIDKNLREASSDANKWGAFGNIVGAAGEVAAAYFF